jgi:hypothetical protein
MAAPSDLTLRALFAVPSRPSGVVGYDASSEASIAGLGRVGQNSRQGARLTWRV